MQSETYQHYLPSGVCGPTEAKEERVLTENSGCVNILRVFKSIPLVPLSVRAKLKTNTTNDCCLHSVPGTVPQQT